MINSQNIDIIDKIGKYLLIISRSGEIWIVKKVHRNNARCKRRHYRTTYYIPIEKITKLS